MQTLLRLVENLHTIMALNGSSHFADNGVQTIIESSVRGVQMLKEEKQYRVVGKTKIHNRENAIRQNC